MPFDKSKMMFPIKNEYAFLSHCGVSPLYSGGFRAVQLACERQMRLGSVVLAEDYHRTLRSLREAVARLLNTGPQNVAFVKNTSEGIGLIAAGYPFTAGNKVIGYRHEYPANRYPWELLKNRGVEYICLDNTNADGKSLTTEHAVAWSMNNLKDLVHKGGVKVVAISHVQFKSGYAADLKALGEFCENEEIDLIVDAAQSLGAMPIDAKELKIAAVVSSGWKWLLGPLGTGLMYVSPKLREKLLPVLVGAEVRRGGEDYEATEWPIDETAKQFEYSTSPLALATALDRCIREVPLAQGVERIQAEIFRLQDVFLKALKSKPCHPIFDPEVNRSPILSLVYPGDASALSEELIRRKVYCTARGGYLRIAPHYYTDDAEIIKAAEILNAIA